MVIGPDAEVVIKTSRLLLRTWRLADLAPFAALNADSEAMAFLGGPIDRAASDALANGAQQSFRAEGFGKIAIERRIDGAFLGSCGLSREPWYPDDLEIGGASTTATGAGATPPRPPAPGSPTPSTTSAAAASSRSLTSLTTGSIAVMARLGLTLDHRATLVHGAEVFEAVIYVGAPLTSQS